MVQAKSLPINEPYSTEILGLGEIYEIMSVERLRKSLLKEYKVGILYLAELNNLNTVFITPNTEILQCGYVDRPPWRSKRKENGSTPSGLKLLLAKLIFRLLLPLERFNKPHMIYFLVSKNE